MSLDDCGFVSKIFCGVIAYKLDAADKNRLFLQTEEINLKTLNFLQIDSSSN